MMYMPCLDNIQLMEAIPPLVHRTPSASGHELRPRDVARSIQKFIPEFELDFDVDPVRQAIAESWPNSLDDSAAREEWGWNPKYDLDAMTEDMLKNLKIKLGL